MNIKFFAALAVLALTSVTSAMAATSASRAKDDAPPATSNSKPCLYRLPMALDSEVTVVNLNQLVYMKIYEHHDVYYLQLQMPLRRGEPMPSVRGKDRAANEKVMDQVIAAANNCK